MSLFQKILRKIKNNSIHSLYYRLIHQLNLNNKRVRYCPVCKNYAGKFLPHGAVKRPEAKCPSCGSMERHRLTWIFLQKYTDFFKPPLKKVLHLAPEKCFIKKFKKSRYIDYLSADLSSPRAMVKMDITDIQYPDETFDVILCSHVLEHIPDDHKAMAELYRVLKPSGWAILQVPLRGKKTYEDPNITDPKEREKAFGQWDHVRFYGEDYFDRLHAAGFTTKTVPAEDFLNENEIKLMKTGRRSIFYCTKQ